MTTYLTCINKVGGVNKPECRDLAKAYLACRMDRYVPGVGADVNPVMLANVT
jgi:hypothetical protein